MQDLPHFFPYLFGGQDIHFSLPASMVWYPTSHAVKSDTLIHDSLYTKQNIEKYIDKVWTM